MKKILCAVLVCWIGQQAMAFSFTDVVAKLQRAQEFAKVAERFGEWQGYAADTLSYMDTSLKVYNDVNRALRTADWTDFIPQITWYDEAGVGHWPEVENQENLTQIWNTDLDNRSAMSTDLKAYYQDRQDRVVERMELVNRYAELLQQIEETMAQRTERLATHQETHRSISVGSGEANQTAQMAFLGTLLLEQTKQMQELQTMILMLVQEHFTAEQAARREGEHRGNLNLDARAHNREVIRKMMGLKGGGE